MIRLIVYILNAHISKQFWQPHFILSETIRMLILDRLISVVLSTIERQELRGVHFQECLFIESLCCWSIKMLSYRRLRVRFIQEMFQFQGICRIVKLILINIGHSIDSCIRNHDIKIELILCIYLASFTSKIQEFRHNF